MIINPNLKLSTDCISESLCKSFEGVQVMETINLSVIDIFKCLLQAEKSMTGRAYGTT